MEKQPGHQLELFSKTGEDLKSSVRRAERNYFGGHIWRYEKTILIIIALLATSIISFSLGIEKGRRAGGARQEAVLIRPQAVEPLKEAEVLKQAAVLPQGAGYTIQVASFKTDSYAQKEIKLLRKRGYEAVTLNKGEYVILCVGNFSDKEKAQSLLSELKRYYKDCSIRRL